MKSWFNYCAPTVCGILISSSAYAGELQRSDMDTRPPEAIFSQYSPEEITARIANACMDRKWSIDEQTNVVVTCSHEDSGFTATLTKMDGKKPARRYRRFNVVKIKDGVRIQGTDWAESQNAFGRIDRETRGSVNTEKLLLELGGAYPDGTTFDCCFLGVNGEFQGTGKTAVFLVSVVYPSSAAGEAGLAIGDKISEVNKKPIKDADSLTRRLTYSFEVGTPYTLTVQRNNETLILNAVGKAFPAAGSAEYFAIAKAGKFDGY